MDILKNSLGRGYAIAFQIQRQGIPVDIALKCRMGAQGPYFRRENQMLAKLRIIKRLDPQAVPNQGQGPLTPVPQGKGEHPDEAANGGLQAPFHDCRQNHFGIRMTVEFMAPVHQLRAHFREVIDLAIIGNDIAVIVRGHGLGAVFGQIDNRQPAESQRDARLGVKPLAIGIRSPVMQGIGHGLDLTGQGLGRGGRLKLQRSRQTTHLIRSRQTEAGKVNPRVMPGQGIDAGLLRRAQLFRPAPRDTFVKAAALAPRLDQSSFDNVVARR